ncbi:MAG: hypothetical protein L0J76_04165 [Tetragenococcus halophilus]|nr:hypothetical protein [Tetragenococcus halophilus]
MNDNELRKIIDETTEIMLKKHSNFDKVMERNSDLADDDGKISQENIAVLVMNESISYTNHFAYVLIKKLKDNSYFSDFD